MLLLDPAELRELTGKTRGDAQCRVLERMGIAHKRRPDGTIAVLRTQVEAVLGGGAPAAGGTIPSPSKEPELEL
jgi:hypothetical protein